MKNIFRIIFDTILVLAILPFICIAFILMTFVDTSIGMIKILIKIIEDIFGINSKKII